MNELKAKSEKVRERQMERERGRENCVKSVVFFNNVVISESLFNLFFKIFLE